MIIVFSTSHLIFLLLPCRSQIILTEGHLFFLNFTQCDIFFTRTLMFGLSLFPSSEEVALFFAVKLTLRLFKWNKNSLGSKRICYCTPLLSLQSIQLPHHYCPICGSLQGNLQKSSVYPLKLNLWDVSWLKWSKQMLKLFKPVSSFYSFLVILSLQNWLPNIYQQVLNKNWWDRSVCPLSERQAEQPFLFFYQIICICRLQRLLLLPEFVQLLPPWMLSFV